jgi:hypothetical protein
MLKENKQACLKKKNKKQHQLNPNHPHQKAAIQKKSRENIRKGKVTKKKEDAVHIIFI